MPPEHIYTHTKLQSHGVVEPQSWGHRTTFNQDLCATVSRGGDMRRNDMMVWWNICRWDWRCGSSTCVLSHRGWKADLQAPAHTRISLPSQSQGTVPDPGSRCPRPLIYHLMGSIYIQRVWYESGWFFLKILANKQPLTWQVEVQCILGAEENNSLRPRHLSQQVIHHLKEWRWGRAFKIDCKQLKGTVHPKMKTQPLSLYWWNVRWSFVVHKRLASVKIFGLLKDVNNHFFLKKQLCIEAPRDVDYVGQAVWTFYVCFSCFFNILKQVSSSLGKCCNSVLLWSSRNVLRTSDLHLTFHQHESR